MVRRWTFIQIQTKKQKSKLFCLLNSHLLVAFLWEVKLGGGGATIREAASPWLRPPEHKSSLTDSNFTGTFAAGISQHHQLQKPSHQCPAELPDVTEMLVLARFGSSSDGLCVTAQWQTAQSKFPRPLWHVDSYTKTSTSFQVPIQESHL